MCKKGNKKKFTKNKTRFQKKFIFYIKFFSFIKIFSFRKKKIVFF